MRNIIAVFLAFAFLATSGAAADTSSATAYTYDANGNLTSKTEEGVVWRYLYDVRDLLKEVQRDGVLFESYQYDYQGRRIRKAGPDGVIRYIWDDDTILLETDDSGNTIAKYDHAGARLVTVDHVAQGRAYYLFDGLGSAAGLAKPDGSLAARYRYDVWGRVESEQGGSSNPFLFTGHQFDSATGFYNAKARYYDPEIGRFLSEDPFAGDVVHPPSLHRYQYAFGNPTVYTDPTGECALITDGPCSVLADSLEYALDQRVGNSGIESLDRASRRMAGLLISPLTGLLRLGRSSGDAASLLAESVTDFSPARQREMLDSGEFQGAVLGASLDIAAVAPAVRGAASALGAGAGLVQRIAAPGIAAPTRVGALITTESAESGVGFEALHVTRSASAVTSTTPTPGEAANRAIRLTLRPRAAGTADGLQTYYPPNQGFLGESTKEFLYKGDLITRHGGSASSRFFAPVGTPEGARALPPGTARKPIRTFEVLKPFEVDAGSTAPWFGALGLGKQYRTPVTLEVLLERGIIREVPTTP